MVSINNLAMSLISVFIAVYLLDLGYSLQWIIYYLMIHHAVLLVGVFLSIYVTKFIGLINIFFIRLLFLVGYLLLLFSLSKNPVLFFIIPVLSGLESAFYWTPLNILTVRNTKPETMGSAISKFIIFPKIISFLGPIISGYIVTYYGFSPLFILSIVLFIISTLFILPLKSEKINFDFSFEKIKKVYKQNKVFIVPEIIDNLAEDAMVLWTIFIFLILESFIDVGFIASIVAITSILLTYLIGYLTDKWNKHKLIKIGALLLIFSWVLNASIGLFMPISIFLYIGTILITLSLKTFTIPYGTLVYNSARKDDVHFLALREVPTIFGRQILFIIALVFHNNLPIVFLFVASFFIYFLFFNTRKLEL